MKYSQLKNVKEQLLKCSDSISLDELASHPALLAAEDTNNSQVMEMVAMALVEADTAIKRALDKLDSLTEKSADFLDEDDIESIGALASSCEASDNPLLRKKADVLDQLLINFAQKGKLEKAKIAQEEEIAKLREKYKNISHEVAYEKRNEREERLKAESVEAIKNQLERRRPLEAPLNTRYCPDHNGTGVIRVGEGIFQCPLDKKLYNYYEGYTTNKGVQVPGGDVSRQTLGLGDRKLEQTNFSTRETKLNEF